MSDRSKGGAAARDPLARLRRLCLKLPGAHEVIAWGEPTFRVRNRMFATYAAAGNHHGSGRPAVWVKSTLVTQDLLVRRHPERFFVPAYVGHQGWIGIQLDRSPDWEEIAEVLRDAHGLAAVARKPKPTAPKSRPRRR